MIIAALVLLLHILLVAVGALGAAICVSLMRA